MILDGERCHAVGSLHMRSLVPWNLDVSRRHDIGVTNFCGHLRQSVTDSAGLFHHSNLPGMILLHDVSVQQTICLIFLS